MPKIPDRKFLTIQAVKRAVEKEAQKEKPRNYIGASSIGDDCSRKIWYSFNNFEKEPLTWLPIFAADDGHLSEDLMAKRLRMVEGIELYTKNKNGYQFGFDNGFLKGHYDGVIKGILEAPNTWHIWEHKTKEDKFINALKKIIDDKGEKEALKEWDYQYYCQAVLYMHFEGLTRHFMTVSRPGCRDVISIRTNENPSLAKSLIEKAFRIFKAKEPPERAYHSESYYRCKWCQFSGECWK